jgi:hypothetical protein
LRKEQIILERGVAPRRTDDKIRILIVRCKSQYAVLCTSLERPGAGKTEAEENNP